MSVVNTKSTIVSNADSVPPERTPALIHQGRLRESVGTVEVAAADDNNSVYRVCRVHSSWRISSVEIANDAITAGTDYNVGIWDIEAAGGAVVSENLFADAIDLSSGHAFTDYTPNIALVEAPLWKLLGLSDDPHKWYDLAAIGIAVGSGAGTISARVRYVDGS